MTEFDPIKAGKELSKLTNASLLGDLQKKDQKIKELKIELEINKDAVLLGIESGDRLDKHIYELKAALRDLLGCGELPCSIIHHESKDQHEVGEDCPILVRYRGLIEERRQDD